MELKVLKRCIVLTKHKGASLHNKKKISNCFTSSPWSKQRVISKFGGHPLLMYLMKCIHATLPKKNSNFQLELCILYKQDYWRFQAVLWGYLVWSVKVQVIMTWTWACTLLLELDCVTNFFAKFGIKITTMNKLS